jgi:hypothetical protein
MANEVRHFSWSYPAGGARAERRTRGLRTDAVLFRERLPLMRASKKSSDATALRMNHENEYYGTYSSTLD